MGLAVAPDHPLRADQHGAVIERAALILGEAGGEVQAMAGGDGDEPGHRLARPAARRRGVEA